ncbi:senescence domain-containing protein [Haematococcus lacustris]|uniref:Senescence domain-containing protein n=1 Tax=Haematococcus lacustris TaxID=44745 RepID=A0A699Z6W7_HAELA|nr:senescence domain-containing protein [Haematococcus lacustris]
MDTVFKLQEAQLYCSEGAGEPDLVAEGPLVVVIDSTPTECAPTIRAQVADVFWSLGNEVACVKLNEHTYCFNCPDSPGLHLSLLLPLTTCVAVVLAWLWQPCPGPCLCPWWAVWAQLPAQPQCACCAWLASVLSNSCLYNGQRSRRQLPSSPPTATAPQPAPPEANKYEKVATGLVWGGAALSQGIRIAAAAASSGLQQGARLATQHLDPAAQPMAVSETTMKRLVAARDAATKAAHLTGQVAQGVASVIIKVASGAVHAAEASGITKGLSKAGVDTNSLGKVGSAGVTALEEVCAGQWGRRRVGQAQATGRGTAAASEG